MMLLTHKILIVLQLKIFSRTVSPPQGLTFAKFS